MRNNLTLLLGVVVLASSLVSDAEGGVFGRRGRRRCQQKPSNCCQQNSSNCSQPACGALGAPRSCTSAHTCLMGAIYTINNQVWYNATKCGMAMMSYVVLPAPDRCAGGACVGCTTCADPNVCSTTFVKRGDLFEKLCKEGIEEFVPEKAEHKTNKFKTRHYHHFTDADGNLHHFVWWESDHAIVLPSGKVENVLSRTGFEIDGPPTVTSAACDKFAMIEAHYYELTVDESGTPIHVFLKKK